MKIQFLEPLITEEDVESAVKALRSGWLVGGNETTNFEIKFAAYLGVKGAVFTSSCTAALHLSLILAGVSRGDEVITTPLSYVATSNAILYCGATPVFVDVDARTGLMDPQAVSKAITRRTRAILPVHLYGQMVDMKSLSSIARRHGIPIVEDAAHAIEAEREGVRAGARGLAACFSFHVAKNITSGQGGCIASNSGRLARRAVALRRDGVRNEGDQRIMRDLGYKYQGTEFQAALLSRQLERIDEQWKVRRRLWDYYAERFEMVEGVAFPQTVEQGKHACHMFVIWVDPRRRDGMRKALASAGIETSIHYNPIHLEPYYRKTFGYRKGDFPVAERLGFSTITLPLHLKLAKTQQEYVVETVAELLGRGAGG
jgi:dTDP-4-amino-4,6-dideoxygalactose transaminase